MDDFYAAQNELPYPHGTEPSKPLRNREPIERLTEVVQELTELCRQLEQCIIGPNK